MKVDYRMQYYNVITNPNHYVGMSQWKNNSIMTNFGTLNRLVSYFDRTITFKFLNSIFENIVLAKTCERWFSRNFVRRSESTNGRMWKISTFEIQNGGRPPSWKSSWLFRWNIIQFWWYFVANWDYNKTHITKTRNCGRRPCWKYIFDYNSTMVFCDLRVILLRRRKIRPQWQLNANKFQIIQDGRICTETWRTQMLQSIVRDAGSSCQPAGRYTSLYQRSCNSIQCRHNSSIKRTIWRRVQALCYSSTKPWQVHHRYKLILACCSNDICMLILM